MTATPDANVRDEAAGYAAVLAVHWRCASWFVGGQTIKYACGIKVDGPQQGLSEYDRAHLAAALVTSPHHREHDERVRKAALEEVETQIKALRPDLSTEAIPTGDESLVPAMTRARALNDAIRIIRAASQEPE